MVAGASEAASRKEVYGQTSGRCGMLLPARTT